MGDDNDAIFKKNNEARHIRVVRKKDGSINFKKTKFPASILYHVVLVVVKHTPVLELVPGHYPESFLNGEQEGGLKEYRALCRMFYNELDNNEDLIPNLSLNQGDIHFVSSMRISDEWVDCRLDNRHCFMRFPLSSVVVLTPEDNLSQNKDVLATFKNMTIRF